VVHPGAGNSRGTLLNALLHRCPALAGLPRAGIVHRLDKDTSGLLVVAKTLDAHTALVRQLAARAVKREYVALVHGAVARDGEVVAPIGRHPVVRTRMAVVAGGRPARTVYRIVERFPAATRLAVTLDTGRTHQIRVHMHSIGHPLLGDPVYGRGEGMPALRPLLRRQALHAARLALAHPATGEHCEWTAPLPADLRRAIESLRGRRNTPRARAAERA
jgi:23S rRNA pseudouridine1911/1915/1917 synthase